MRIIRNGLVIILSLCLLAAAATAWAETYVEMNGMIPDSLTYPGNWRDTYTTILYNHSGSIRAYQNRTINMFYNGREYHIPCLPVKLQDLNGDGVSELLFLEEASGGNRGDLYIYSNNGRNTQCVLYVPGITRLDYDDMLGFDIYLSWKQNYGNTLVIEHYKYENPWALQFAISSSGRYNLLNWLTVEGDYSGEGDDRNYQNGMLVSYDTYLAALNSMRGSKTGVISEYFKTNYSSYGLDMTWNSAVDSLGGQSGWDDGATRQNVYGGTVYGLTIDKLATRKGPGTQYEGGGTYSVKGQYIEVLAKAYDKRNGIWWVKCVIPYHGENRILWTGYKRFDHSTLSLDDLPEEFW